MLGHVKLNGKFYRIEVSSYNKRDMVDVAPKASVPGGAVVYSDLGLYQLFVQNDWKHGFGFPWYTDASGYLYTEGSVDTRHSGLTMLYTQSTSSDTDNHQRTGFVTWDGYLWSYGPSGVRKCTAGTWATVYTGAVNAVLPTSEYLIIFPDGGRPLYSKTGAANTDSYAWVSTNLAGANNDMTYTAKAAGIAGNSITIAYTDSPSNPNPPTVAVVGSAITVTIDAGVTTAAQIKTAIEGDATANALVAVANTSGNSGAGTVPAMSAIALTGGGTSGRKAEYTTQSTVSNANLRFEAIEAGTAGNSITVTYVTGASAAGKEVVSVTGTDITVTLHADSTAAMVMSALLADTPAKATCTTKLTGNHNDLTYTAVTSGEAGNQLKIIYTLGASAAGGELVTVSGNDITIQCHKNTKAAHVVAAVTASTTAAALVTVANATSNDGTGKIVPSDAKATWKKEFTFSNGSTKSVTDLITVQFKAGETGAGKPGAMTSKNLQGGSGIKSWIETGVNDEAVDYKWAVIHNGQVYAGKDATHFVHYASETTLSDLEGTDDDPGVIKVGSDEVATSGAIVYAGGLYVSKDDGLYNVGEDNIARRVLDYTAERSSDNFRSMAIHNGYVYFPIRDRIYQWNSSRLADVTPNKLNDTFPYKTYGRFRHFVAVGQFLYCVGRTNETSYSEALLCWDGVSWFRMCDLVSSGAGEITAMGYDAINNRLWYHHDTTADVTYYIQCQDRSEYPYASFATTGTHSVVTSRLDMGYRRIMKSTPTVMIQATNLSSSVYLLVDYSIDGATWKPWGGTEGVTNKVTTNGLTELLKPLGTDYSTLEYSYIQIRVRLVTGTATQSPILEGVMVRFLLRPDVFFGWSFQVIVHKEVKIGEHTDHRTARDILRDLEAARDSKSPLEFIDLMGEKNRVYITSLNEQGLEWLEEREDPDIELIASVNLVELR